MSYPPTISRPVYRLVLLLPLLLCISAFGQTILTCPEPNLNTVGWKKGTVVHYYIDSSFTADEQLAITSGSTEWNNVGEALKIKFEPTDQVLTAELLFYSGNAGGGPGQVQYTSRDSSGVLLTAKATIDNHNLGAPPGQMFFDSTQYTEYILAIKKSAQHEIGHTLGMADEYKNPDLPCFGQTAGKTVMNGKCDTNDSEHNQPNKPTSCDLTSISRNPQLCAP